MAPDCLAGTIQFPRDILGTPPLLMSRQPLPFRQETPNSQAPNWYCCVSAATLCRLQSAAGQPLERHSPPKHARGLLGFQCALNTSFHLQRFNILPLRFVRFVFVALGDRLFRVHERQRCRCARRGRQRGGGFGIVHFRAFIRFDVGFCEFPLREQFLPCPFGSTCWQANLECYTGKLQSSDNTLLRPASSCRRYSQRPC